MFLSQEEANQIDIQGGKRTGHGDCSYLACVHSENAAQPQRWESHLPSDKTEWPSQDIATQMAVRNCSKEARVVGNRGQEEEARIYRSFCNKHQIVKTSKDYCKRKPDIFQLRNWGLSMYGKMQEFELTDIVPLTSHISWDLVLSSSWVLRVCQHGVVAVVDGSAWPPVRVLCSFRALTH